MVIARGLNQGSKLWVIPPAVMVWLEMLTVVAQVPHEVMEEVFGTVTCEGFIGGLLPNGFERKLTV